MVKVKVQTLKVQSDWQFGQIRKALRAGLILLLLVTALVAWLFDIEAARATILGALLAWLAQLAQVWFSFRYRGARQAGNIYRSMWRGQLVKWLIVIVGFALLFSWLPQNAVRTSTILSVSVNQALFSLMGFIIVTLAFVRIFWRTLH